MNNIIYLLSGKKSYLFQLTDNQLNMKIHNLFATILNKNIKNATFTIIPNGDYGSIHILNNNKIVISFNYYIHLNYIRLTSTIMLNDIYLIKNDYNKIPKSEIQYVFYYTFLKFIAQYE